MGGSFHLRGFSQGTALEISRASLGPAFANGGKIGGGPKPGDACTPAGFDSRLGSAKRKASADSNLKLRLVADWLSL